MVTAGRREADKFPEHSLAKQPAKRTSGLMGEIEAPVSGCAEHFWQICKKVARNVVGTRTVDEREREIGKVLEF